MQLFLKRKGTSLGKAGKIAAVFCAFAMLVTLNVMTTITSSAATTSQSVERKSYDSIELTWSTIKGAESYQIWRATGSADETSPSRPSDKDFQCITTGIKGLTYVDSGLEPYRTYWYKVADEKGELSSLIGYTHTTYDNTKNVKALTNGDNVTITWDAVEGASAYAVTRSYVVNGTVVEDDYEKIVHSNIFTTDNDASKIYTYKVVAYLERNIGNGTEKFYGDTDCQAVYIMTAPKSVKAASKNYNTNLITFSAVDGASGYNIYRSTKADSGFAKVGSTAANVYTYQDTGLTTGTTYYYRVEAYKSGNGIAGAGIMSSAASAMPMITTPVNVTAVSKSYNSIKVTWGKVDGAQKYEVYRSTSKSSGYSKIGTTKGTSYTDKKLKTNQKYYYKVNAVYGKYISGYSSVTNTKAVPAATSTLTITSRDYNQLSIAWKKVSGANKYVLYRSTREGSGYKKLGTFFTTTFLDSGVKGGVKYYYKVVPYKDKVKGKERIESGVAVTKAVQGLKLSNKTATANKLTWKKTAGADSYRIYRSTKKNGEYAAIGKTTKLSYTDKKAQTGKKYYYKVCGVIKGYEGEFSTQKSIVAKPPAVKNLKVTGSGKGKAKLTWDKYSYADSYQIYVSSEKKSGYRLAKEVRTNSYVASLASNSTTYFRVYAVTNGVQGAYKQISYTAISALTLNATEANIKVGGSIQLSANILPANATDKEITWKSSNKKVATVTNTGLVTGKKNGTCTITAKASNGMTATCRVTVSEYIIVLDPGHGGSDPGTSYNGVYEKNVNLKIAQYAKAELETYNNVKVIMTRTADTYPTLIERSQIAANYKADFFVSIHCNMLASKSTAANGSEVYASLSPNYSASTARMGNLVMSELVKAGMKNKGVKTVRGESGADYYAVIRNTVAKGVPAILIEEGYLSGSSDYAVLTSDAGQRKIGTANATAIATYFELKKK